MTRRKTYRKDTNHQTVVVGKIYAEWCHFCQEMAPHWDHMKHVIRTTNHKHPRKHYEVEEISDKELDAGIARINQTYLANSDKKLALQGGYPTLFKIVDGHLSYYHGSNSGLLVWATGSSHKTRSNRHMIGHGLGPDIAGGSRKALRKSSSRKPKRSSRKAWTWFGFV